MANESRKTFQAATTGFKRGSSGFTLAELLIALAILGMIATFTIPKILQAQQDSRNKAIVKEAVATMEQAYQQMQLHGQVTTGTNAYDLMQYVNYVKKDTAGTAYQLVWATPTCIVGCYLMHNGGVIGPYADTFAGTASTNAVWFDVDPDFAGPTIGVEFALYYNGMVRTYQTLLPNTTSSSGSYNPTPAYDPPWFSWN